MVKAWTLGLMAAAALMTGCTTTKLTEPARAASEQLLLSTAADRAITNADFSKFAGKKVFLDITNFESYDSKYVIGTIKDALSRSGALIMKTLPEAEIIVEPRSGGFSIDSSDSLVGVPSTATPIPLTGAIQLPEIALYKSEKEFSIAKIALLAYENKGGEHFFSSGPLVGKAYESNYKLLFVSWMRTDVPEEKYVRKHPKKEKKP